MAIILVSDLFSAIIFVDCGYVHFCDYVILSRWMQINFFKVTSLTVDRCMLLQTTLA